MEWILLLIGIAYSLWSSFKNEEREKLKRQSQTPARSQSGEAEDFNEVFRRLGAKEQRAHKASVTQPLSQRSNPLSRASEEIRRQIESSIEEVFLDERGPSDAKRHVYDSASSYDTKFESTFSSQSKSTYQFTSNEGLHMDGIRPVSELSSLEFDAADAFAADVYELKAPERKGFVVDRSALRSYVIMHEVLSPPKHLRRPSFGGRRKSPPANPPQV
jgi:hypothetical protein